MNEQSRALPQAGAPTHDIIVLGASAGGIEALCALLAALPAQFPGALFVTLHVPATGLSYLDHVLSRAGPLSARYAHDNEPIVGGQIYIAPADHHLLLTADRVRLTRGPRENHARPAIDPMFRTAAVAFGAGVVGVLLSGLLNDGVSGLLAIKARGGVALAQDPATALFAQMPQSACDYVEVDGIGSASELASRISDLARQPIVAPEGAFPVSDDLAFEANIAGLDSSLATRVAPPGVLTSLSCPECHGPIWEEHSGDLAQYRCRVGHAFTAETMQAGQKEYLENMLWNSINSLEESAELYERLATHARARQNRDTARDYSRQANVLRERMDTIRQMISHDESLEA
jgi:two-component system chemotaxis response regulator CheB